MAKRQIFERTNQIQDYLTQLEDLLKKNRGSGTYEAYNVNPRAFRIGGKVVDPSGLGQDVMNDSLRFAPYDQSTIPFNAPSLSGVGQYNFPEFPQEIQRIDQTSLFNDPRYQEALKQPVQTTQSDLELVYQATGKAYGIQELKDGGILYNDGIIRYSDGTVRDYTGQDGEAISSMADGSVGYSDGSFRRPATIEESNIQTGEPAYPIASQADGTVMYSDGIARAFDPNSGSFKMADSGVINFFNTFDQGYQFQPRSADDLTGQCAWFSEQITTLPDGSEWRIGNTLDQKQGYLQNYLAGGLAFLPGQEDARAGQSIVFDEGTQYGHVATISEVFMGADGRTYYRLTESNYAAPNTVTHDRVVSAEDPKIMGIVKTVPRQGYTKVGFEDAPQITGERALQVEQNASSTGEQERPQGEDAPIDKVVQEAPLMSQEVQQPNPIEQAISDVGQTVNNIGDQAAQVIKQVPGQVATGINTLNPTGSFDLGVTEQLQGNPELAAQKQAETISNVGTVLNAPDLNTKALSEEQGTNPFRQLAGNLIDYVSTPFKSLGLPDTGLSEAVAGGKTVNTDVNLAPQAEASDGLMSVEKKPQDYSSILGQNIKDVGTSIVDKAAQVVNPVVAKAGEGIDALKDKASNLFQKTPLMGLFQGQKQVGDAKGATLFEGGGQKSNTPTSDAFFKYGGADQYANYLIDNAEQAKGGALDTSLFKPEFFQDPNRVSNVFGETSQGATATGKYKDYLGSQIKSGYDQPYRTETKTEGNDIVEYKIPIPEYFQNDYFKNLLSSTPDTLKSGFSFDKFQMPQVTRTASEYKGEVPIKDSSTPIFKSGIVDLFKRTATQPGQLVTEAFKSAAPVYQPSQQSRTFEVPQTSSNIFQAPSAASLQLPQSTRTVISQVSKPTLADYLSRGKTEAQYYAETGQQSTLDAMNKAQAYTAPQAQQIGSNSGSGVQKVVNKSGQTVTAAPGYTLRVDGGGNVQQVKDTSFTLPNGSSGNFNTPTSQPSAQLAGNVNNSKSVFASAADWIKNLFKR